MEVKSSKEEIKKNDEQKRKYMLLNFEKQTNTPANTETNKQTKTKTKQNKTKQKTKTKLNNSNNNRVIWKNVKSKRTKINLRQSFDKTLLLLLKKLYYFEMLG